MTAIIYMKSSVDIYFSCSSTWTIRDSTSGKVQPNSYFYTASKPVLRSIHLPIRWVPGLRGRGVRLTNYLCLILRPKMSRWYDYFTCTLSWRMVGKSYLYHRYHNYILVQTHTHTHIYIYIYISSSILVTFPTLYFFFKRKVWKSFVQLSFRCTYYILKALLLFLPWQVDQNRSHINVQMKKQKFWGCTTLYLHFPKNYKDWIFFYNGMIYQARSTSVCCFIWYCHEGEDSCYGIRGYDTL